MSTVHTQTFATLSFFSCIYHIEYVVGIHHKDASKPVFQNQSTQLFKAFESSESTYWGVDHLWFKKFSKYHCL